MAASFNESQKLDYLWKKVGYGVAKTSIPPPGAGSKEAFNESIASPLLYRGDLVWAQSGSIPAVPPSDTSAIVQVYKDGGGAGYSPTVECTEDLTAPDNQTWKTNLANWIPTQFGDNYLVQVYVANTSVSNPQTVGTRLFQAGSGSDDTWFFDYQAGVLNFNGTNIPSVIAGNVTGKSVYVVGYRYVGEFGVGSGNSIGNLTINNTTIGTAAANANIVLNPTGTGLVTIDTVTGLVLPTGNTAQRPNPGTTGTIRYNSALSYVEYYNGSSWVEVGSGGTSNVSVSDQQITPDGTSVTYTLDQETNQVSILVAINGIGQIPGSSYSVTGNSITFSEAPLTTDIVDIRFLATAATRDKILNGTGNTLCQQGCGWGFVDGCTAQQFRWILVEFNTAVVANRDLLAAVQQGGGVVWAEAANRQLRSATVNPLCSYTWQARQGFRDGDVWQLADIFSRDNFGDDA
jgi:hypothetical protein